MCDMQHRSPQSLNELFDALKEQSPKKMSDVDALIASMPRRVGGVISKKGGNTR